MCVIPGADRTIQYGEEFRSFVVRINETDLSQAMQVLGHKDATGWSSIAAVLDERTPIAEKFARCLRDPIRLYDDEQTFLDRRIDEIMGRSLAAAAAAMLCAMVPDVPRVDGPSFAVAEAAERVTAERIASPLTSSEIAEAVGQTLPCVRASLLLYTGLLPNEMRMLVRLIVAEEYGTRSYTDPSMVAKACGFVTEERYQLALAQRERLIGLLKRHVPGRGYAAQSP